MLACFRNKEESWAIRNGRMLLEESISLFDGKVNPIRCFSARELELATNNFDRKQVLVDWPYPLLYKGFLRGQPVIVKRPQWQWEYYSIRDIVVSSRLSVHKNVLKLIGCCLDTRVPLIVYEAFGCEGTLYDELLRDSIGDDPRPLLTWKHRLKFAVDLSNVVAYLHTALPRPLVHRDIKPQNILLDKENGVIKLFNFDLCMSLPEGQSFIEEAVKGTWGYADPEYLSTYRFNEKADVYGFGVTLLNLLSGQRSFIKDNKYLVFHARGFVDSERFKEILDPRLSTDEPWPGKDGQFKAFLMLALECTRDRGFDRPDMTEVGTRLMLRGVLRTIARNEGFSKAGFEGFNN